MPIDGFSPLGMMAPSAAAASSVDLPLPVIRQTLLDELAPGEREALWGGMDASPYLRAVAPAGDEPTVGVVRSFGVAATGPGGLPVAVGVPAFVEFRMPAASGGGLKSVADRRGASLVLPSTSPGRVLELWWTDEAHDWTEIRSFRWTAPEGPCAVLLDRIPHFDPSLARRVRVVARSTGPIAAGGPVVRR